MLRRVEVGLRPGVADTVGANVAGSIRTALGFSVDDVRLVRVYTVSGLDDDALARVVAAGTLHDPVLHEVSLDPIADPETFDFALEIGFRPGVTDNEGRTARDAVALVAGLSVEDREKVAVYTSHQYLIRGGLTREQAETAARDLLANELIQRFEIKDAAEWRAAPGFEARAAKVSGEAVDTVARIPLADMNDEELMDFSRRNTLALSLEEMHVIRDYYARPEVRETREKAGIGADPTDAEVECLAQTWSEHCKHKIFASRISYRDDETGETYEIDSLFKTHIIDATRDIRAARGDDDFCLSVFKDNAGVLKFNDTHSICVKMETHNSPSALDPYGGALTGIVGVNRDPMGTGIGAELVCNTDVFCFASPFHDDELPPRLLHPRRVMEGVREGVEHGGNKSGVPTVNGSFVFDERYLGKPLVYCGTIGMMPYEIAGKPSHEKAAQVGDHVVMAGGRIGKDGIHGATFSSEELHEGSPATAVQIGDPITQRKMYDFIIRARDLGMYNAITDNGAGGLSSSVGEMAEDTGGVELDLAKAPLKYDGLRPWEILLSEAQERMTLAVPPEKLEAFTALAAEMDVEVSVLGRFTDSGYLDIRYNDREVAYLSMDFLHDGLPQMRLDAVWKKPELPAGPDFDAALEADAAARPSGELLKDMLGRLNICSKEYVVRQYDHEVKGGSVVKPMVGVHRDGPGDAGVMRPRLDSDKGLVVSHGICPKFSDHDTYWMTANCVDEAVRNAVACGANPRHMAGVDNFCWCDPVQSEKTPDGRYKLAQLVRANQALDHFCRAYGVPCVSGKDSMKNDYYGGGVKISIPPTLLYSVVGVLEDVNRACTSDFKQAGDILYILGTTFNEMGGSELASQFCRVGGEVPQVDAVAARSRYIALHEAMLAGEVTACHDLSDGGFACAVAEMAIGGRLGAKADIALMPCAASGGSLSPLVRLYSESASRMLVTVRPENATAFEKRFAGQHIARIGTVTGSDDLVITDSGSTILSEKVEHLAAAWKAPLNW